jgi:hypothetical protein
MIRQEHGVNQASICLLIERAAPLKISKNAGTVGFWADLRHATHKGMSADFGVIARITTCRRFRLRTQRGISDTPSPLSTRVITVAIKPGSFTMRGENPARLQTPITSSNKPGAPCRWN